MKKLSHRFSIFVALALGLAIIVELQTLSSPAAAQTGARASATAASTTASPEEVGLSSDRLERIANAIQRSVDEGRISGGVALVARHGKVA